MEATWSFSRLMHYVIGILLITGMVLYWYLQPPGLNPMADPKAAEAMALVQTHRAERAPTVLQALANRVRSLEERGQGVRLGEWRVEHMQGNFYVVSVWIREQGRREWVQRDYTWQVDLVKRIVFPLTPEAGDLMPPEFRPRDPLVPGSPLT